MEEVTQCCSDARAAHDLPGQFLELARPLTRVGSHCGIPVATEMMGGLG